MPLFDIFGNQGSKKFYVRDFKNAYRLRPDVNPPRQQFQGYVNFILNRDFFSFLYANGSDSTEFRTQISSMVRTAELPSVQFKTETKNQYNRKKIVNTGFEYNPVNMTVFDSVGNEWLITLMKYFSYHYMDPRNKSKESSDRDLVRSKRTSEELSRGSAQSPPQFMSDIFDSNNAGYNLNQTPNFFERIDYVLYHNNKGVQYSIMNPVLTSFKPSSLDYSSSQPMEFALSFEYEKFTVHNQVNFTISPEDADRFEDASDLAGPAFEPNGNPTIMEERNLAILGSEQSPRQRSGVSRSDSATNDAEAPTAAGQTPSVSTYGNATISTGSGQQDTNVLTDILGDVVDVALQAAIHGGNIKDAAVNTAIGRVVGSIIDPPAEPVDRGVKKLPGD